MSHLGETDVRGETGGETNGSEPRAWWSDGRVEFAQHESGHRRVGLRTQRSKHPITRGESVEATLEHAPDTERGNDTADRGTLMETLLFERRANEGVDAEVIDFDQNHSVVDGSDLDLLVAEVLGSRSARGSTGEHDATVAQRHHKPPSTPRI